LDQVFVVTAAVDPAPILQLIDRLLVVAEANEISAAVVVNKVDLDPGAALVERCRRAGYQVYPTSTTTGDVIENATSPAWVVARLRCGPSTTRPATRTKQYTPSAAVAASATAPAAPINAPGPDERRASWISAWNVSHSETNPLNGGTPAIANDPTRNATPVSGIVRSKPPRPLSSSLPACR